MTLDPGSLAKTLQAAFAQAAGPDGWANLASVGSALKAIVEGFDPKDYGHSKLSNLLKASGVVELRQDTSQSPNGATIYGRLLLGAIPSVLQFPATPPTTSVPPTKTPAPPSAAKAAPAKPAAPKPVAAAQPPPASQPPPAAAPGPKPEPPPPPPPSRPSEHLTCWCDIDGDATQRLAKLALEEIWDLGGHGAQRGAFPILDNYLRHTFYRLKLEQKILTQGELSAFNTGLVDRRYEPIFGLFKRAAAAANPPWELKGFCIAGEGAHGKLLARHFNPLPSHAHYFQDPGCVFYDVAAPPPIIDWEHVIIENLDRLPPELLEDNCPAGFAMKDIRALGVQESRQFHRDYAKALEADMQSYRRLKGAITTALELALKRVRWNYKTAIPAYYPNRDQMVLMLPLALVSEDVIDVALVVEKAPSGNYLGHTILPLDWAYAHARLVCRLNNEWLNLETVAKASRGGPPEPGI